MGRILGRSAPQREKAILTWGGGVLAVVIAWSVLWAPAQEGRAHLRETLPAMQRQLAQMTAQANEARALVGGGSRRRADRRRAEGRAHRVAQRSRPRGDAGPGDRRRGADPVEERVVPGVDELWLDDVRKQFKVQVSEAHVTALKEDGQVDLTASLQPSTAK